MKDPDACTHSKHPVLADLIYGWGNATWSALEEYLAACIHHAMASRGPILECGSGLSTILLGVIAKKRGQSHWAFEHKPEWATKVQIYLDKYKLDSVVLCLNPLKDYGNFCWYDPPLESIPDRFSLVICDGPPGSTKGGRYGVVPIMLERLEPGCVILLDDAHRTPEIEIAKRWATELDSTFEICGAKKPYIKMTVVNNCPPTIAASHLRLTATGTVVQKAMNVFVLNTGRCGSTTFARACRHISNFSSAHESRTYLFGEERLAYPSNHIEVDNRLSWLLGRLDRKYGDRAVYVHLKRNIHDTAASFVAR